MFLAKHLKQAIINRYCRLRQTMSHTPNATILAIDTATGPCSVALWKSGRVAFYQENRQPSSQSAALVPMIEACLNQTNSWYGDLTAVACTVGPGSFTGIRVGLAAARGICFSARIPGLGFTTLHTMAYGARIDASSEHPHILSILNAGKGEYYFQAYEAGASLHATGDVKLGSLEQAMSSVVLPATVAGNVDMDNALFIPSAVQFPRADALAELAASGAEALPLSPFYIRPPDAKPMAVDRR